MFKFITHATQEQSGSESTLFTVSNSVIIFIKIVRNDSKPELYTVIFKLGSYFLSTGIELQCGYITKCYFIVYLSGCIIK